jgi:hypothetical protein
MRTLAIDALRHRYEAQKKNAEYTFKHCTTDLGRLDAALAEWVDADQKLDALSDIEDDYDLTVQTRHTSLYG